MEYIIKGYKPEKFFNYFEEISAIPRGSGNEKGIMEYLKKFADERGLWCYTDDVFNVIIKKPGSAGCESLPPVILQGHTDIVCEKNQDTVHDFLHDGLKLYVDDEGFLHAKGTTLGADNGTAVCFMLTILDSQELVHPPLECVFTAQEEVGLVGAAKLDYTKLSGRTMINMDAGPLGNAVGSCAGGLRIKMTRDIPYTSTEGTAMAIAVRGLQGGHSGGAISKTKGNSLKIISRVIDAIMQVVPAEICSVDGGDKDNAIPRESDAVLVFKSGADADKALEIVKKMNGEIRDEFGSNDPGLSITCKEVQTPDKSFGAEFSAAISKFMMLAPSNVYFRNFLLGDAVISSVNFASIHTADGKIEANFSPRSATGSIKQEIRRNLEILAGLFGFETEYSGEYPGWSYNENSRVRDIFKEVCVEVLGKEPTIHAIHGGLECGLFIDKLPGLDAIAIGPNGSGGHTPEEKLDLASCETQWKILTALLEKLAK